MFLSSLYLYPLLAAIVAFVFMYIDTRIFDNKKTKTTYVKNTLLVGFIVWVIMFILDIDSTKQLPFLDEQVKIIPEIGERMLSGLPDF
jgi:hypothetical protein